MEGKQLDFFEDDSQEEEVAQEDTKKEQLKDQLSEKSEVAPEAKPKPWSFEKECQYCSGGGPCFYCDRGREETSRRGGWK